MLLLCSHSPNDVPYPRPQRNVSIVEIRGGGGRASVQTGFIRYVDLY